MIKAKNFYIRKTGKLGFELLCKEKKLLLTGVYGSFAVQLCFPLVYYKEQKKLLFKTNNQTRLSFARLYHYSLFQFAVGLLIAYKKQLSIVGIGYQVVIENEKNLVFNLGFSHSLRIKIPNFVQIECPKPRIIKLKAMNYQKLTNFACVLKNLRLPSIYKQKGIYFLGESINLKQGKKT